MLLADMGTQYTKIFNSDTGEYEIIKSIDWQYGLEADVACGHNCKHRTKVEVNELVALAKGAVSLIEEDSFVIVDVGSRDIKSVTFKGGEYVGCDWNYMCGALAGFTMELLSHHYGLNYDEMEPSEEALPVKCGILGISSLFDRVAQGEDLERAVAGFVKGMAINVHECLGSESTKVLSGKSMSLA